MPSTKTVSKATKAKPLPVFLKPKPIKLVTKKVLNKIADDIYNPKTGHYLNLCKGTLQNGPDPVCQARPMHCGLGELYFVVTGHQPEDDEVNEEQVIQELIKRSTINEADGVAREDAVAKIKKLGLYEELTDDLVSKAEDFEFELENKFYDTLNEIPNENDRGAAETEKAYFERAKRVAAVLRRAAALLPR
jgi:hypothetical protein